MWNITKNVKCISELEINKTKNSYDKYLLILYFFCTKIFLIPQNNIPEETFIHHCTLTNFPVVGLKDDAHVNTNRNFLRLFRKL